MNEAKTRLSVYVADRIITEQGKVTLNIALNKGLNRELEERGSIYALLSEQTELHRIIAGTVRKIYFYNQTKGRVPRKLSEIQLRTIKQEYFYLRQIFPELPDITEMLNKEDMAL